MKARSEAGREEGETVNCNRSLWGLWGGKEISVHASVTCTFGQKMYQEFYSLRA